MKKPKSTGCFLVFAQSNELSGPFFLIVQNLYLHIKNQILQKLRNKKPAKETISPVWSSLQYDSTARIKIGEKSIADKARPPSFSRYIFILNLKIYKTKRKPTGKNPIGFFITLS